MSSTYLVHTRGHWEALDDRTSQIFCINPILSDHSADFFPGGEGTEDARGDEREGDPSGSAKRFGPVGCRESNWK